MLISLEKIIFIAKKSEEKKGKKILNYNVNNDTDAKNQRIC